MKYGMNAKVYSWAFTKLLKDYYRKYYPDVDIKAISKDVNTEYRAMIERTPGIGGSGSEENLIGACYFFAMAKRIPGMTPGLMDDIIQKCIKSDLMVKLHEGKKKKGTMFSDKEMDRKMKEAEASHSSTYEMDWEFTFEKGKDEFRITYTKCGLCKLAEREHMEEYLPCMCRMDYPKYELVGAKLQRDRTLAGGDDCCNFHVIRDYDGK